MSSARITLLPGDGIGPEVVAQAHRVLQAIGQRFDHSWSIREAPIGGVAIDLVGVPLPHATLALCQESDAVLLGAVGGPQWDSVPSDIRPERGLLALRKGLELYANIRPVTVIKGTEDASPLKRNAIDGVDLVVVRELTGGIYFGEKTRTTQNSEEYASDLCSYTTTEIARVVRLAASLARQRRNKLTSVDKANVLETSRLWRSVATHIMQTEFPDVQFEHLLVDACAMHLIKRPSEFDVIVTENMFGDILTDEASIIAGSIGLLPSASLGAPAEQGKRRRGLYEPIHGSAPDIAGAGIANPIGTILSAALMLRYSLGMESEAQAIEQAVSQTIIDGYVTRDLAPTVPSSTEEVGSAVVDRILHPNVQKRMEPCLLSQVGA
jgi:3-isopropylmalate dehydrogenase